MSQTVVTLLTLDNDFVAPTLRRKAAMAAMADEGRLVLRKASPRRGD